VGLAGKTDEELKESLVQAYIDLAHSMDVTLSLKANRVEKEHFDATVDKLAELAYEDQCTTANPREPLISELKAIMEREWDGQGTEK